MPFSNPLVVFALCSAALSLVMLVLAGMSVKKRKFLATSFSTLLALLLLALAALFSAIFVAIAGYQALTREELAATVTVMPDGQQQFIAKFLLPDGSRRNFRLSGDQLYVDAHILKWKPVANLLGLHTSYELDRVSGRYADLKDEQTKPRTVFSLAKDKPVDMFALRRKFAWLNPLLDAEYGSATFINTAGEAEFKVLVSTTGLLIRTNAPAGK